MDSATQNKIMYLFERVGEPLCLGPRGASNMYYSFTDDYFSDDKAVTKNTADKFRENVGVDRGTSMMSVKSVTKKPDSVLKLVATECPKSILFSYFVSSHRDAAAQLREVMLDESNQDDFVAMASYCRDSRMVNPKLWIYAFSTACLQRQDLKGLVLPAIWEIMPDQFVSPSVIREAQKQAVLPETDRKRIEIPKNNTGNHFNPENRVAYFREDIGINSHHWHWHLIYRADAPLEGPGTVDRKGELFYWMHHDMLARYDAERLANGLGLVKPYDFSEPIHEGYFPKLYDTNSGIVWGIRQEGTKPKEVNRLFTESAENATPIRVRLEDMETWKSRILEAIDTGVVMLDKGKTVQLTAENGIDILGNLLEPAEPRGNPGLSNRRFYGDFHASGHLAIAFSHDPDYSHMEQAGVIGDPATSMRDPVFYRWHRYIDLIFERFKATLPPYTIDELVFPEIRVIELSVETVNQTANINNLLTHWTQSDMDLSRGLDFGRINMFGPVWVTMTHLNNENFFYKIVIENIGTDQVSGTVRIFMAPKLDEYQRPFEFSQQREQFISLDRFTTVLNPGTNQLIRQSTASSLTIPWEQTFRDLERKEVQPEAAASMCGCGWPQHMLLPRGTPGGMLFDLYVIVTNTKEDLVPNPTESFRKNCHDAMIHCGLLGEKYPDKKPMGFPFDRNPRLVNNRPMPSLDTFVSDVPNSKTTQIRVVHRDVVVSRRSGGAPESMEKIILGGQPSSQAMSSP